MGLIKALSESSIKESQDPEKMHLRRFIFWKPSLETMQRTRAIAKAVFNRLIAERDYFEKRERLLKEPLASCVVPNDEIQIPSETLTAMSDVFVLSPNDKFVLVSRHSRWVDYLAGILRLKEKSIVEYKISDKKVMNPVCYNEKYQAVEGIDYIALGFELSKGTYMVPHHVTFLPFAKEISVREEQEFFKKFPDFWDSFY